MLHGSFFDRKCHSLHQRNTFDSKLFHGNLRKIVYKFFYRIGVD